MSNYDRLLKIAGKESRLVLGLMSGTSMDGLDIALCRFSGSGEGTKWEVLEFVTMTHTVAHRSGVRKIFADPRADLETMAALDQEIAAEHGRLVEEALKTWGRDAAEIDLIGSHGQTVYHAPHHQLGSRYPERDLTVQLGDGDFLARRTGIVTVSDFRQKHIAAGGEGAPLAPYGDLLLFSDPAESRILINIGGISNFTFIPALDSSQPFISSDIGPGNTLMDAYMRMHFSRPYDEDARIARAGEVLPGLLDEMMADPFFTLPLPRTTGPEVFNLGFLDRYLNTSDAAAQKPEDVMATLNAFTAKSIAVTLRPFLAARPTIYLSGGGVRNELLTARLQQNLPDIRIETTSALGMDPDAKEAVIFALLAHECLFGNPVGYAGGHPGLLRTTMGKVSFPE